MSNYSHKDDSVQLNFSNQDSVEKYFECIMNCSISDKECVIECVEELKSS